MSALSGSARPAGRSDRRRRRDRHGRGRRGILAPAGLPLARSRAQQFDELLLDAIGELERAWPAELARLQFGVEDVPARGFVEPEFSPGLITDRGVVLAELRRDGPQPLLVIYRRPVEARTLDTEERADLVFSLVVDLVAEWLGRDADDIDPR